jgi:hypothetical protein
MGDKIILDKGVVDSYYDFVFVVKKQMKLNHKESDILQKFTKDIEFLFHKVTGT